MGGEVYIPRKFIFNTYALTDTLTHIIGRHALKFGFQVRHIQENTFVDPSALVGSPGSVVYGLQDFPFVPSPDFSGESAR